MSRPRRRGRDIHGVLLLDKPQGMSSNDVLQKVKRIYNANRAGHTGALDPLATGMLPICLGEATKFSSICWILTNAIAWLPVWASVLTLPMPMGRSCRSVR